jgi:hypothetical protein
MRTLAVVALAAAAVGCSSAAKRPPAPAADPALTVQGRVEQGPFKFSAPDLAKLPRRSFTAVDPRTGQQTSFEGISVAKMLSDRMQLVKTADILVVRGGDRSAVVIPMSVVRSARPVLADKAGGAPLDGLRLAWPNLDAPGLDSDPRSRWWWVDGVKVLEVTEWERSYARALRLPPGASDEARLGADAFVASCIHCHKVRGTGGDRGPDLTDALKSADPKQFASTLRHHQSTGVGPPVSSLGEASLEQISTFLRAIAAVPGTPQPEETEPEPPRRAGDPLNPPPGGAYPPAPPR